jgi:asparagine synthase (glutamine-hydrolysing)
MCGISGFYSALSDTTVALEQVTRSVARLAHRGPDDSGVEIVNAGGPQVVFGHRRLSILDLSMAGHQPMRDPVSGNWIVFNGEIYNFRNLRLELEAKGHRFVSQCDTEVILKGYSEWNVGCWRRLRGIFAFGLWDAKYKELYLVRDHLGVKPLYFARTEQGLAFASEVRAILAGGWASGCRRKG